MSDTKKKTRGINKANAEKILALVSQEQKIMKQCETDVQLDNKSS